MLEGDKNTAYFQAVANYRSRKKRIECLQGPNGFVYDQKGMMDTAVNFYKELFAKEVESGANLAQNYWDIDDKVSREENILLTAPFLRPRFSLRSSAVMLKEPWALTACPFFSTISSGI